MLRRLLKKIHPILRQECAQISKDVLCGRRQAKLPDKAPEAYIKRRKRPVEAGLLFAATRDFYD